MSRRLSQPPAASPAPDRSKLPALLDELSASVESMLLTGLTTASASTREKLEVAFREASRNRLRRFAATLRHAATELTRFAEDDARFSRERLGLFLNRSWLLSRGLAAAIRAGDEAAIERLNWEPKPRPASMLAVVTIGVAKKVAEGVFCAFDFRLRAVRGDGVEPGQPMSWTAMFPMKPGLSLPAEAFLLLPQKQKFKAEVFLQGAPVTIDEAAVAADRNGVLRVDLGEKSTVAAGKTPFAFADWERLFRWDTAASIARIRAYEPTPLDLPVELLEEVVLRDWELGEPRHDEAAGRKVYPLACGGVTFDALVSDGEEGRHLETRLAAAGKRRTPPPLFGLIHFEMGRIVLQPLSVLGKDGPEHLMISDEKVDRTALLRTLKF